ncbi:hypothetical protein ACLD9V_34485 [Streptomyces lincolnensis]|uniref:hypothetical protein n=1 Tax=Streptomyces lincolnensis TaxID=1915 RepID=UPI000DF82E14|nr:hypothetical protein [Streptomyces lincolnensis]
MTATEGFRQRHARVPATDDGPTPPARGRIPHAVAPRPRRKGPRPSVRMPGRTPTVRTVQRHARVPAADDGPTATEVVSVAVTGAGRRSGPAVDGHTDGHAAPPPARGHLPHAIAPRPRRKGPRPSVLMPGRMPTVRTVRGPGHAIRPTEAAR